MMINKAIYNLLVVLGPTASGKTKLAVLLADRLNGQIISADSRQVYKGLDIGSGKDLAEYVLPHRTITSHLIDVTAIDREYSVFHFQQDFYEAFHTIVNEGQCPILAGGTGLYLEAALKKNRLVMVPADNLLREKMHQQTDAELKLWLLALKPNQHNQTDLIDRQRLERAIEIALYEQGHQPELAPDIKPLILGVLWEDRRQLRTRIAKRLKDRLKSGLIEEVELLMKQGVSGERLYGLGLEYRHVSAYLQNYYKNREELFEKLFFGISQFAKRQLAWFRRMERQGYDIKWIPEGDLAQAIEVIDQFEFKTK